MNLSVSDCVISYDFLTWNMLCACKIFVNKHAFINNFYLQHLAISTLTDALPIKVPVQW